MTDKYGCDPRRLKTHNRKETSSACTTKKHPSKPDKSPKVKWQKNLDEGVTPGAAADDVKVGVAGAASRRRTGNARHAGADREDNSNNDEPAADAEPDAAGRPLIPGGPPARPTPGLAHYAPPRAAML